MDLVRIRAIINKVKMEAHSNYDINFYLTIGGVWGLVVGTFIGTYVNLKIHANDTLTDRSEELELIIVRMEDKIELLTRQIKDMDDEIDKLTLEGVSNEHRIGVLNEKSYKLSKLIINPEYTGENDSDSDGPPPLVKLRKRHRSLSNEECAVN